MEIKTKLVLGQQFYSIYSVTDEEKTEWFVDNEPHNVDEIVVTIRKINPNILYGDDKMLHYVLQENCFATQTEAQAECDRRNNETKKI